MKRNVNVKFSEKCDNLKIYHVKKNVSVSLELNIEIYVKCIT